MDDFEFLDDDVISKTQRKKEAHAQQDLGERLTQLPDAILDTLPLSERLRSAIDEFKRLPAKHGAIKRQLQFIGKLMRDSDSDALTALLDANPNNRKPADKSKEIAEQYCKLILEKGDAGIQEVLSAKPSLNRQQIRQYLRNTQTAKDAKKKAAAEQRLLDYLISSFRA